MNKAVILNVLFSLMLLACKESDSHKLKRLERYVPKDEVVYIADAPIVLGLSKLNYNSMPVDDLPQSLDPNKKPEIDDEVYELVRVKDGDTIVVMGSDGEITVRLLGIDTPEMRDSRPIVKYFAERAMLFVTNNMGSQLFFQIVSPFFQIGSFVGLRYHDFFKRVSRLLQIILSLL
ncbi:MAG: hypothetical protein PHU69_10525, partial [Fermentimonas sp.]|nr:hypothetical protein [Fermentimonas sp.]